VFGAIHFVKHCFSLLHLPYSTCSLKFYILDILKLNPLALSLNHGLSDYKKENLLTKGQKSIA
jgi:hypothetical protein